jgi:hypothetical protein
MEHFIALSVKAKAATADLPRVWFGVACSALPDGLCTTIAVGDEQIRMKKTNREGKVTLTIPLVRNLTENEVRKVIEALDGEFSDDYSITSSRIQVGVADEIEVEVDFDPLIALCTAWAKEQHDEWMKDKIDAGWRYGPSVSMANKTHPLLRQWSDLPDTYKNVDCSKPEQLLKLFNEHGYVLIAKSELDQLIRDSDLT